ncbi:CHASE domain-containing protein [Paraglaciecola sp. L3A3]|uniref:CHASE domain-containing protein n=1 Tax=Paraglaciecola sp. L3A3 TaxID=2686358 RepID=UPI00131D9453|nr:CHASE domain-containing protein [Paraglaciecola sp. L3A3]
MKHSKLSQLFFKKTVIKSLFFPVIILIAGAYISFQAENNKQKEQDNLVIQTLQNDLFKIKSDFEERITFYSYGLKGLHGLISTVSLENFDYQTMHTYSQNRNFQQEFPGVRGIGFIQKVEQHDLAEFLQQQKQMRPDNSFNLRQLNSHNNSLFIIRYIEPEELNKSAVGLDIGSEDMRRNAAISSAINNQIQITSPITLVQADKKVRHGFLILLPLYDSSKIPADPAGKLSHTLGWTYAPILIDEVLSANYESLEGIDLTIADISNNKRTVFYQPQLISSANSSVIYSEKITVFGRLWEFTAVAENSYIEKTKNIQSYTTFYQYMILTVVLALMVLSLTLAYIRKEELRNHQQQLLIARDTMLEETNEQLEFLVKKRTQEMSNATALKTGILKNANYPIIATDTSGLITLFNPAAEKLLGYSADELLLKETPAKFHLLSEIVERAQELTEELGYKIKPGFEVFSTKSNKKIADHWHWTYVAKDGRHIPVMLNLSALKNEHGDITGYIGIAYDLTEQIEKEQALAEAKEIAEKANIAKSEFLANMSHEIRTPLNGIFGTLQLLQQETDFHKKSELLKLATISTTTLNKLVNDILDLSKLEAGKLTLEYTAVNLSELTAVIEAELIANLQQKGLKLIINLDLTHSIWKVDELRLKQILLNVLSNAIKFTQRGQVSLTIKHHDTGGVLIIIKDSGIGMSEEAQLLLFERFEQADKSITRRYGGTGLGMSITHSLVNMMGGRIEVFSKENVGTKVQIFLPLEAVNSMEETASSDVLSTDLLIGKTVLIAEDNEINQLVLSSMLGDLDLTLYMVDNGQLAVDFVETTSVDIILMDIQMPIMGGVEACKLIKTEQPSLPIVAITANAFEQDIKLYKEVGFNAYIAKPFEKEHLLSTIISTLNPGKVT